VLNQFVDLIRSRRSVPQGRLDKRAAPDHQVVREALESARWAPNHRFTEPWRFYLLDQERISRLGDLNAERLALRGSNASLVESKRAEWGTSQGVALFTCRSADGADDLTRREDFAAVCCAAQNFMLHLWSEGIASKWSTAPVWEHQGFWPLLGHQSGPDGEEPVGIFFYGIATDLPAARRNKALSDVLVDFRQAAG